MALMFKPDPMPVDVINVLALGVLDALLGEITELMVLASARYVAQSIGDRCPNLSKRRTKYCRKLPVQAC
jgi:hypothetical protein